ncbi:Flp pilus assembly protein CpaB [Sphingomonas sp. AP4-R1]|uniref:Flp pilus assembly protein CpaB n=1 Tax=Sphingomonas sp. AP4-R1 TaxID=2735134 RepID=UPI0014932C7D|nr:Flp pilus assembly protein CpaB [Sphingomonas sp. AP4-R1]QJU59508.1 Flp pilus assembly protein CpaB [Sphingomonas sp. AP4-R1]
MNSRKLMLMAGALVFALISAMLARSLVGGSPAATAQAASAPVVTGPEVLVATRALPAGTIITPDAFRYQPWPNELVQQAYYIRGTTDQQTLNGTVVRFPITAGQPITQGALVKPGDRGFLAAALAPGMRAVTISVSMASGVAGFVFPGDRVDLLLTQSVSGGGDGEPLKASETIVRNLRVLATDQKTDKSVDDAGKTVVTAFSNVTLEATPKLSEKIAVAQTMGSLSLSLRPIADDRMELERQIAAGEITLPEKGDAKAEKQMMLQIAARPVETDTFTTGAEVSRFARGGVPGKSEAQATAPAQPAPASFAQAATRAHGPVITIARGQTVTETSVGQGN